MSEPTLQQQIDYLVADTSSRLVRLLERTQSRLTEIDDRYKQQVEEIMKESVR